MKTLFDDEEINDINFKPLAEKMRPTSLDDFFGQEKVVGPSSAIRQMIENDSISSMIFWGPPGVGKTTLAKIIAIKTHAAFYELSAVTSGVKEIKEIMEVSKYNKSNGKKTILFVDEIHRFNKAQQDAFLPFVENGNIILIGATTENPSFEVNSALLSRTKVYVLKSLNEEDIINILKRAMKKEFQELTLDEACYDAIAHMCNGDARQALNTLENVINTSSKKHITIKDLNQIMQSKTFLYDKHGEEHYNLISALHKSMRNSDPDAAVYYLRRMLEGGEEPLYIARRLIRFASEDVGMADPQALPLAVAVYQACHFNGMPECDVNLAQAVVYLSMAPKSNALYVACEETKKDVGEMPAAPVPLQICNAPTQLMKDLHYGEGYEYAHDAEEKLTKMQCLPEELLGRRYYRPTASGHEKQVKERLEQIRKWKEESNE